MKTRGIELLDCTLRDGGFALEDADRNNIAHIGFQDVDRKRIAENLYSGGVDIIEVGAIQENIVDKRCFGIYKDIESISEEFIEEKDENRFAVFFRGPDQLLETIPNYKKGLVSIARVCLRYSELKKSLDYCCGLSKKGFRVFIQPMVTERYKDEELELILKYANEMNAEAVYIVDSYGDMSPKDVKRLFLLYDKILAPSIKIGFHPHNNTEMAMHNTCAFIDISVPTSRNCVIDCCCMGMGQGTGNLQTEVIANYLNKEHDFEYSIGKILKGCSVLEKYTMNQLWGYSTLKFIPAINHTAYKYAVALRVRYGYDLEKIYDILNRLTGDLKYRFSEENLKILLGDDYDFADK